MNNAMSKVKSAFVDGFWRTFCVKWIWKKICVDNIYGKFDKWKGWFYLSPAIVLMLIFTAYPIVNTVAMSMLENYNALAVKGGVVPPVNFNNFIGVFAEGSNFALCLWNTALLCFLTVPISTMLALLIAVALHSIKPLQRMLQTVFFLPYVTNSIAIGMVFAAMFNITTGNNGVINAFLDWFGLDPVHWIDRGGDWRWANIFVLVVYIVWNALPFKILVLLGGLQGINKQYYDAAKIDGTSKARTFWRITVPLLSPMLAYVIITSFIGGFKEYSSIVGIFDADMGPTGSEGNLDTMVGYVYTALNNKDYGRASAASLILFGIIFVITMINLQVSKKKTHY